MTSINKANSGVNGEVTQYDIPTEMRAIRYNKIKDFSLVTMPVPQPKSHEVLIKGMYILLEVVIANEPHSEVLRDLWHGSSHPQRRFRLSHASSHRP